MQLLLTLLRILGILILAVILLVLLVVLAVLLVPIRYQVWAKNRESLYAKVKVHWLLHLISLTAEYRDELTYRLKILGFTVFDEKKVKATREEDTAGEDKCSVTDPVNEESPVRKEEAAEQPDGKSQDVPKTFTEVLKTPAEPEQITDDPKTENSLEPDPPPKKSLREKIEGILLKIIEVIQSIPEKIASILEKWAEFQENIGERVDALLNNIDELNQKKERLMKQLQDEQNRFAMKEIFRTLGKLFKHIRPRRLKIKGRLGFDDPAQTGQIFGIIGMLMPLYGEHIQLEAVFDEKVMEGELYLSGRVRIGSLLWMALRLVLRKEVRRLITQLQR